MNGQDYEQIIYNSKPVLRFCEWFDETSEKWNFTKHHHPYIELIYYVAGQGSVEMQENTVDFSIYDTIVMPAYREHQDEQTPAKAREIICLWIDIPELKLEHTIRLHERNSLLSTLFEGLYKVAKSETPDQYIMEYVMKLLLTTIIKESRNAGNTPQILDKILNHIQHHYTESISLDELADIEHISKSYLSRKFKERTGYTVVSYINRLRINMAKQLLMTTRDDVDEIAYKTGFESPKYFYRVFKDQENISPAAFRRQFRSKEKVNIQ